MTKITGKNYSGPNISQKLKRNNSMNIKTQLKIMLTLKHISIKQLAQLMTEKTGKQYTSAKLYGKINRDSISFSECQHIAEILGYEIIFKEIE